MILNKDIETSDKFINVLRQEVLFFNKDITWKSNYEGVELFCSDKFFLKLSKEKEQFIVSNNTIRYVEKDFLDGLVRLRFELIRHLNPSAF